MSFGLGAAVTVEEKYCCFYSRGNSTSIYSKQEALLRFSALYLFSSALYCINFILIFHRPYEPAEIPDWLILPNQNELSYATVLFAAH